MKRSFIVFTVFAMLLPAFVRGDDKHHIDELQIRGDVVLIRANGHTFRLNTEQSDMLSSNEWEIDGDRIIIEDDEDEIRIIIRSDSDPILPFPRDEEPYQRGGIHVDRMEDGLFFRFYQEAAEEVYIEGTWNGWDSERGKMTRDVDCWVYETRLPKGNYHFRIRYRLEGDEEWFDEPEPEERLTGIRHNLYTLEVSDREAYWFIEEASEDALTGKARASYNRVEGASVRGTIGFEHGTYRTTSFEWSQSYSFAIERWSWAARYEVPFPGARLSLTGYDRCRAITDWTVSKQENTLAALFLTEDFYDFVWSRGWSAHMEQSYDRHLFRAGFRRDETEPVSKNTEWSLFGGNKVFRENLFSDTAGVAGKCNLIEGRYTFDTRNYEKQPTKGSLFRLSGDYSGWELGGDYDYWRGLLDARHYHKLASDFQFNFRIMGGAIQGTSPAQEMFHLGGVGTMRAHAFRTIVGNRFFLTNMECRVDVIGDMQCAFFADIGDAWDTPERMECDLEADMGIGIQNRDGDIRVDFARNLNKSAEDDLVVTFRLQNTF